MKKTIIGAIVGGLIIFIWQTLSWTVLDAHRASQDYTPKQDTIMAFLNGTLDKEGGYLLPNVPKDQVDIIKGEEELKKYEAIINSMTPKERKNPKILSYSRKQRIAKGSGTTIQDINRLLKNYDQLKKTMKQMKKLKGRKLMRNFPF